MEEEPERSEEPRIFRGVLRVTKIKVCTHAHIEDWDEFPEDATKCERCGKPYMLRESYGLNGWKSRKQCHGDI
jgi:hypothetical protein